jgi:hypothetical protein
MKLLKSKFSDLVYDHEPQYRQQMLCSFFVENDRFVSSQINWQSCAQRDVMARQGLFIDSLMLLHVGRGYLTL